MRKSVVAVLCFAAVSMFGATSFAAPYGAAGCGLGSMLFHDQSGAVQVFAATTNGTFGSQTFGITTGTSNCGAPLTTASNQQLNAFVQANMDNLAKDMAAGRGETLTTYADLLHVPAQQKPAFYKKVQANFGNIFTSPNVQMAEVIDNTMKVMSE